MRQQNAILQHGEARAEQAQSANADERRIKELSAEQEGLAVSGVDAGRATFDQYLSWPGAHDQASAGAKPGWSQLGLLQYHGHQVLKWCL